MNVLANYFNQLLEFLTSGLGISTRVDPKLLLIQFLAFSVVLIFLQEKRIFRLAERCLGGVQRLLEVMTTGKYRPILLIIVIDLVILVSFYGVQKTYPKIMDEHAHLLIANNFVNGTITGQTHPQKEFFETFFVISAPTYTGKYPPGQGLILALGEWIFSNHIVGVWLTFMLGSIMTYVLLLNFFDQKWSFLGALFYIFNFKILTMWGLSYWGGGLSLLGSVLFWIAFFKLIQRIEPKSALLLSVGFALMFMNRPFESILIALYPTVFLLIQFIGSVKGQGLKSLIRTSVGFFSPIILVLAGTIILLLLYNQQVTGDTLVPPQQLYSQNYERVKPFIFQDMSEEPVYPFAEAKVYNELDEANHVSKRRGVMGFLRGVQGKISYYLLFYFEWVFLIPLVFYFFARKNREDTVFGISLFIIFLGSSLVTYEWGHYIAGAAPLLVYLIIKGGRQLTEYANQHRRWKAVLMTCIVVILMNLPLSAILHKKTYNGSYSQRKSEIIHALNQDELNDLVFVKIRSES